MVIMMDQAFQFANSIWAAGSQIVSRFTDKFASGDPWTILGTLVAIVAIGIAYRQLRRMPPLPSPVPELRLWDHGDRYVEG